MKNQKEFREKIQKNARKDWVWFWLIFLVALTLRFWGLESLPPGTWPVEAQKATEALSSLEKGTFPFYDLASFDWQGPHFNPLGWMIKIFGPTNFVLRFFNVLLGSLTIAGLFLLARKLKFSLLASCLASLALALSAWHLIFSRLIFPTVEVPFLVIWVSLLFLSGFQKNKQEKHWRNSWLFFLLVSLGSLSALTYFYQDQNGALFQKNSEPSTLLLLPPVWIFFFALGFLLSLKELFWGLEKKYQKKPSGHFFLPCAFLQIILWSMLIPGFFSDQTVPFLLKFGGAFPVMLLLAVLPFEYFVQLWKKIVLSENLSLKKWREKTLKISLGGLIFLFLLTGIFQAYFFFFVWAKSPQTLEAFENRSFQMGKTLQKLTLKKQNFFITAPDVTIAQDHKKTDLQTLQFFGWPKINNFLFYGPTPQALRDLPCQDSLYFFQEADQWVLGQFQNKCPNLKLFQTPSPDRQYQFWLMK